MFRRNSQKALTEKTMSRVKVGGIITWDRALTDNKGNKEGNQLSVNIPHYLIPGLLRCEERNFVFDHAVFSSMMIYLPYMWAKPNSYSPKSITCSGTAKGKKLIWKLDAEKRAHWCNELNYVALLFLKWAARGWGWKICSQFSTNEVDQWVEKL